MSELILWTPCPTWRESLIRSSYFILASRILPVIEWNTRETLLDSFGLLTYVDISSFGIFWKLHKHIELKNRPCIKCCQCLRLHHRHNWYTVQCFFGALQLLHIPVTISQRPFVREAIPMTTMTPFLLHPPPPPHYYVKRLINYFAVSYPPPLKVMNTCAYHTITALLNYNFKVYLIWIWQCFKISWFFLSLTCWENVKCTTNLEMLHGLFHIITNASESKCKIVTIFSWIPQWNELKFPDVRFL